MHRLYYEKDPFVFAEAIYLKDKGTAGSTTRNKPSFELFYQRAGLKYPEIRKDVLPIPWYREEE